MEHYFRGGKHVGKLKSDVPRGEKSTWNTTFAVGSTWES